MFSINREWLCRRHQDRSRKTLSVKFPRCRCAASLTLKQKCVIYELFLRVKHGTQMFWQRQYNSFSPSVLSCVNVPLSNTWVKLEVCYDNLIKMGMILKLRCDHRYVLICMQRVKIEEKIMWLCSHHLSCWRRRQVPLGVGRWLSSSSRQRSSSTFEDIWRSTSLVVVWYCIAMY